MIFSVTGTPVFFQGIILRQSDRLPPNRLRIVIERVFLFELGLEALKKVKPRHARGEKLYW